MRYMSVEIPLVGLGQVLVQGVGASCEYNLVKSQFEKSLQVTCSRHDSHGEPARALQWPRGTLVLGPVGRPHPGF